VLRTKAHPLSGFAQTCPLFRTLFRLTPGGVRLRQSSVCVFLKLKPIAHPYASIARPSEVGKTPAVDLPHIRVENLFFRVPKRGKSSAGVFPTSEGRAIDAYGWAIGFSFRKTHTELWRTLTPPGVSLNRVRNSGQARASPLNGCAWVNKMQKTFLLGPN
jgi:hypothetical protein